MDRLRLQGLRLRLEKWAKRGRIQNWTVTSGYGEKRRRAADDDDEKGKGKNDIEYTCEIVFLI